MGSHWAMGTYQWACFQGEMTIPHQPSTPGSPSDRLCVWGPYVSVDCLVQVTTAPMSWPTQQPCHVWKSASYSSPIGDLTFALFLHSLHWALGSGDWYGRPVHSWVLMIICAWPVMSVHQLLPTDKRSFSG